MSADGLPNKLSDLLFVAIDDLKEVRTDRDNYRVDMDVWHEPGEVSEICTVCMAGAVMAKSLWVDKGKYYYPADFGHDTRHKLKAIESFRQKAFYNAVVGMTKVLGFDMPFLDHFSRHNDEGTELPGNNKASRAIINALEDCPRSWDMQKPHVSDMLKAVNFLKEKGF